MSLQEHRVHVVLATSYRLRYDVVNTLVAQWDGTVERSNDPARLADMMMQMDTPSLFGGVSLYVVSMSDEYLKKHAALIAEHIGKDVCAGVMIIHGNALPKGKNPLRNTVKIHPQAHHEVYEPNPYKMVGWLQEQLDGRAAGCERSMQVAQNLIEHRGANADALLSAIDVLSVYADEEPITPEMVHEIIGGSAAEAPYVFADAFFTGDVRRALSILYAGKGLNPQMAVSSLASEIRKFLCVLEWDDAVDVKHHAGMKSKPTEKAMWAIRRRASGIGKRCLLRLMTGILQAQKDLRSSGHNTELVMETLIHNASRVIRSMR